ncbi:beta-glucosidase [Plantibacter sp. 2H11-2]|uniref:beta-glucosidase family protein n=1 Tax=Plantibacter sp. 2H11-2 TaxID=3414431 RepID=UPI003CEE79E1
MRRHLDITLSPADRASVLLGQMTVPEKAQQLVGVLPHSLQGSERLEAALGLGIGHISGMNMMVGGPAELAQANNEFQRFLVERTRLGIPAIVHSEALNGLLGKGFTSFPTAIGLAATWNPELVTDMADIIRRQARSIGITQALSPVLDVARDPRWGRVHETYGEEVLLVTAMSVAYVSGIQGTDLADGVLATAKHFLGYAATEAGQNLAATHLGPRELYDVHATPFEAAIRLAKLQSVMNSYSEIDGEPVATSRAYLTEWLRDRLGFTGTLVSDYRTTQFLVDRQHVARTAEEAGALTLAAGLDVELPGAYAYGATLATAVEAGRIDAALLDRSVLRVLEQKFALGLFERPIVDEDPIVLATIAAEGAELSATLAEQSITLIRNDGVLPLDLQTQQRIAVVGPHAASTMSGFANYTYPASLEMLRGLATGRARLAGMEGVLGDMPPAMQRAAAERMEAMSAIDLDEVSRSEYGAIGFGEALAALNADWAVETVAGFDVVDHDQAATAEAIEAAKGADVIVVALGGRSGAFAGRMTEGEGTDAADIDLPQHQRDLVKALAVLGKPIVGVLFGGRPYGLAEIDPLCAAILVAYYPGPAGAEAVARVLAGLVSPSGKLPFTLPRATGQTPIYQAAKTGSGYRREAADNFQAYSDLPASPLYSFGHGLSYTRFEYGAVTVTDSVAMDGVIAVAFDVTNVGDASGAEVAQIYASTTATGLTRPWQQLVAFARVELAAGERARVSVDVDVAQLGFSGRDGRFVVEPGSVTFRVGASSEDIRTTAIVDLTGELTDVSGRRSFLPEVTVSRTP